MKKIKDDNLFEGGLYSLAMIIILPFLYVFLHPLFASLIAGGVLFFGSKKYA